MLLLDWHVSSHRVHVRKGSHVGNAGVVQADTLILIEVVRGLVLAFTNIIHAEAAVEVVELLLSCQHAVYSIVRLTGNVLVQEVDERVARVKLVVIKRATLCVRGLGRGVGPTNTLAGLVKLVKTTASLIVKRI